MRFINGGEFLWVTVFLVTSGLGAVFVVTAETTRARAWWAFWAVVSFGNFITDFVKAVFEYRGPGS